MNSRPAPAHVHRRYRERVDRLPDAWPELVDALLAHRSVRRYSPDPLPSGTLELLVAAAQSASTSSNKQFWSVVAVEEPARKQRLAQLCASQAWMADAPLLLVWLADLSRMAGIGESRGVALEGLDYLESFLVALVDAALAAQTAAVAAEALGLGVVYIGAMRDHPLEVARELALPPRCFAVFGMCVGYPDPAAAGDVKPRLPQAAVLHREQYAPDAWTEPLRRYVAHNNAFRSEQGMPPLDWDEQIIGRVRDAAALKGREHLREALTRMGFQLR
jgi:nitroreductase